MLRGRKFSSASILLFACLTAVSNGGVNELNIDKVSFGVGGRFIDLHLLTGLRDY